MSSGIQFFYTFEPQFNSTTEDINEHILFNVLEFNLIEAVSEPYRLEAELISTDPNIDFSKLLDQPACFTIWQTTGAANVADITALKASSAAQPMRRIHGIVSGITLGKTGHRYTRYSIVMEPQLVRTMLSSDWKIFQKCSVQAIVSEALKDAHIINFSIDEHKEHLQREYCVEADETDYNYIARLLSEEGFVYTHIHTSDKHQLLITDTIYTFGAITTHRNGEKASQTDNEGNVIVEPVLYNANPAGGKPYPALYEFAYKEQVRTARQTQRDYTFRNPRYMQEHSAVGRDMPSQSLAYERFDYPGRYKQDAAGAPFTQTRISALRNDAKIAIATGDDARIEPGLAFELTGHPRTELNQLWRPIRITHTGKQYTAAQEDASATEQPTGYSQTAELVPATADWKPPLLPKPLLHGTQIAVVVGPKNEAIYCDEWGRVKVQFPWDRYGKNDEHSSCWIRVTQGWGMGGGDGQQSIPRIGQEVLIGFLDSDPDQPMVIGRANNALNPPPYELPKHKTRSTWRSQTHKGEGFNELRFEDEREQEEIYIHAQKDQNIHVNNDESTFVGHDRTENVIHDEEITIGHDRSERVDNDERVIIGNDRNHQILRDDILQISREQKTIIGQNHDVEVHGGRKEIIHGNNLQENKGSFDHQVGDYHKLKAGSKIERETQFYILKTQESIVLQGPGGKITIDSSGITLDGAINIRGMMNQTGLSTSQQISLQNTQAVDATCITCWLKAAQERSALMALD